MSSVRRTDSYSRILLKMSKLLNITLCFIFTINFGYSQSIKRNVISSFGTYDDWFLPNSEEMLAVGSSFIGNYFGTYQHYWISEEYWQSAPNNSCPSSFCTSADFAFTFYIDGSNSMNLNYVHKEGSPEKVIAFRQF